MKEDSNKRFFLASNSGAILRGREGFTLVELLVVIGIIGILSSLALISLNNARIKARDALRKGDMSQIRTALNMYYDDHGYYPVCGDNWTGTPPDYGATVNDGSVCYSTVLTQALAGGSRPYIGQMPQDPSNPSNKPAAQGGSDIYLYRYVSDSVGSEFVIVYGLEENPNLQVFRGY